MPRDPAAMSPRRCARATRAIARPWFEARSFPARYASCSAPIMRIRSLVPCAVVAAAALCLPSTAKAEPRLRWEAGAAVGPLARPGDVGPFVAFHLQLGVQEGRVLAIYYQGEFGAGRTIGPGGYMQYNSLVFEATLFNHLQLGGGPSYDLTRVGTNSAGDAVYRGYFGAVGRIGYAIGGENGRYRRGGLLLGLEIHPTFATGPDFAAPTAVLFTIGGGQY